MEQVTITMPKPALDAIDATWPRTGCRNRSEFLRDAGVLVAAQVERHLERKAEKSEEEEEAES